MTTQSKLEEAFLAEIITPSDVKFAAKMIAQMITENVELMRQLDAEKRTNLFLATDRETMRQALCDKDAEIERLKGELWQATNQ